jgi:hypothetical protein
MKMIKSKVKYKQHITPRCELFFCKKCHGLTRGTLYDIATNKIYCSIHQTEEVVTLSSIHYLQDLQRLCCDGQQR